MEIDTTRDPYARRPKKLFDHLNEIEPEFDKIQSDKAVKKITDPFEYLSCEQIGDSHSLLKALYSDRFLGLSDIETRNNLVLTGPRGCGKSTVFKSLSLQHRLMINEDHPGKLTYIGIYYRCDDLYFAFPRYMTPGRQEAFDIPLHFIISTLLNELFDSIKRWASKYYKDEFDKKEGNVSRLIWELLELSRSQDPGIDSFSSFLNDRPFFFFIDDYSSPKITIELQQNLNRLLMQRTSSCFFKLSTESPVSYARSDIDTKAYVEGREFTLINLGLIYIHAGIEEKLQFIEDVFNRRLKAIDNYPVSDLEVLLGSCSKLNFNEDARLIRRGKRIKFWGKESLCHLCCGDIYHIIDLVKRMVVNIGGVQGLAEIESPPKISAKEQSKATREQAGNFLKGLRILPNGSKLVEIVAAFGIIAHSYLRYRNSKNVETNPPWQAHRIEPYEPLKLSNEAQKIYDELLRYSVFIEDVRGSMRDSIGLEANEVEKLLLLPKEFEKSHLVKKGLIADPDQPFLPGFEMED